MHKQIKKNNNNNSGYLYSAQVHLSVLMALLYIIVVQCVQLRCSTRNGGTKENMDMKLQIFKM